MPENGRLRVYGHGQIEVELVTAYLADIKHAYESILVFEAIIRGAHRASRDFPPYPWHVLGNPWPITPRRAARASHDWPPGAGDISSYVPRSEQLLIAGVQLRSPGFWDFLGKLNPLDVLRQYLTDRHERRKDREYRESAEKRRLLLENLSLENEVISGRIKLARDLGASDRDLAPLLNELVYKPLIALDRHQDKGVIEHAEVSRPSDGQRQ